MHKLEKLIFAKEQILNSTVFDWEARFTSLIEKASLDYSKIFKRIEYSNDPMIIDVLANFAELTKESIKAFVKSNVGYIDIDAETRNGATPSKDGESSKDSGKRKGKGKGKVRAPRNVKLIKIYSESVPLFYFFDPLFSRFRTLFCTFDPLLFSSMVLYF